MLEEATKMLKGLTMKSQEEEPKGRMDRLAAMQDQLDELRKPKVLRLSRMERQETFYGLLDSGATHPMRSAKKGEDLSTCETVQVTLANGHQVEASWWSGTPAWSPSCLCPCWLVSWDTPSLGRKG